MQASDSTMTGTDIMGRDVFITSTLLVSLDSPSTLRLAVVEIWSAVGLASKRDTIVTVYAFNEN